MMKKMERVTHRDINIYGAGDRRAEVWVDHHHSESQGVTGLVDGLVCLDEHRVRLVDVTEAGRVGEGQCPKPRDSEVVVSWTQVTNLDGWMDDWVNGLVMD